MQWRGSRCYKNCKIKIRFNTYRLQSDFSQVRLYRCLKNMNNSYLKKIVIARWANAVSTAQGMQHVGCGHTELRVKRLGPVLRHCSDISSHGGVGKNKELFFLLDWNRNWSQCTKTAITPSDIFPKKSR